MWMTPVSGTPAVHGYSCIIRVQRPTRFANVGAERRMTQLPAQSPATTTAPARPGAFAPLSLPAFRWLLLGTTLSNAAQWIQQVTLSWLVYDLTASGTMLGTLNLVRSLATLGLALDRLSRRALMFMVNGWLFAISFALGLALLFGLTALWPLFVFTFLGGIAQAIDLPLRQ